MKLSRWGLAKGTGAGAICTYLGVLSLRRDEETVSLLGIRWRHEPTNQTPTVTWKVNEKEGEKMSLGALAHLAQWPGCLKSVFTFQ